MGDGRLEWGNSLEKSKITLLIEVVIEVEIIFIDIVVVVVSILMF